MNDFIFTFLMIGYLFKQNSFCDMISGSLAQHSTLKEAMDYCNGHDNCNCVEVFKASQNYRTYSVTVRVESHPNIGFVSWVTYFLAIK